jgi:hypothetical protein
MNGRDVLIYALCDPRTGAVRYIGKTEGTLEKRLQEHVSEAMGTSPGSRNAKVRWVRSLLAKGLWPDITLLETATLATWRGRERAHIEAHRAKGCKLLNAAPGGGGGFSMRAASAVIATALRDTLISPNVADSNLEPANLVDTTQRMARALFAISTSIDALAEAVHGLVPQETENGQTEATPSPGMSPLARFNADFPLATIVPQIMQLRPYGPLFLRGACPFHDDARESLRIHVLRNVFWCEGCTAHGNSVDFLELLRTGLPGPGDTDIPARKGA